MLDKIIRESIYRIIKENANDVSLVKERDNYGRFGYFIVKGSERIGQIRITELTKRDIIRCSYDQYADEVFEGITFPAYLIDSFYISDEHRRFGYGRQLLNEVIKDFGKYSLILQAGSLGEMEQRELVKMYQRYGFKNAGHMEYGSYMIRLPEGANDNPKNPSFNLQYERLRYAIIDALEYNGITPLLLFDADEIYNTAVAMAKNKEIANNDVEKIKMLLLRACMIDNDF